MNGATATDFHERFEIEALKSSSNPESPHRMMVQATSEVGSLKVDKLLHRFFSVPNRSSFQVQYNYRSKRQPCQ